MKVVTERTSKVWKFLRILSLLGIANGFLIGGLGMLIGRSAVVLIAIGLGILLISVALRCLVKFGVYWCHE